MIVDNQDEADVVLLRVDNSWYVHKNRYGKCYTELTDLQRDTFLKTIGDHYPDAKIFIVTIS